MASDSVEITVSNGTKSISAIYEPMDSLRDILGWIDDNIDGDILIKIKDIYRTVERKKIGDVVLRVTIVNLDKYEIVPVSLEAFAQFSLDEDWPLPPFLDEQVKNNEPKFNYVQIVNSRTGKVETYYDSYFNDFPRSCVEDISFVVEIGQIEETIKRIQEMGLRNPAWTLFNGTLIASIYIGED